MARLRKFAETLVADFEQAAVANSWKGARHPNEWAALEAEYAAARERLIWHLMEEPHDN